jgi:hypothetical protein
MPISYQQTDTTAVCARAVYCSALSLASGTGTQHAELQAVFGGTAGSGSFTLGLAASQTTVIGWAFEIPITNGETWLGGTWTVRLRINTANSNITWTNIDICRVSSGCVSQASIGSASSLGISLGSTGVKTATVSGSAQTPSAGDKVWILLGFTNAVASTQTAGIVDDQLIDSPFVFATDEGEVLPTIAELVPILQTAMLAQPQTSDDYAPVGVGDEDALWSVPIVQPFTIMFYARG